MRLQAEAEARTTSAPTFLVEIELAGDQLRYLRSEAALRDMPLARLLPDLLGAICDDRIVGAVLAD
jgi:hypothetical protein